MIIGGIVCVVRGFWWMSVELFACSVHYNDCRWNCVCVFCSSLWLSVDLR